MAWKNNNFKARPGTNLREKLRWLQCSRKKKYTEEEDNWWSNQLVENVHFQKSLTKTSGKGGAERVEKL